MIYAQFWQNSTGFVGTPPRYDARAVEPIPACGSDAVMRVDGRLSARNAAAAARSACARRGYIGFSLHRGRTYADARTVRALELI